jgi:DNA anti-recombination protein RmuC
VLGFFIIPARRRRVLSELRAKIAELRTSLAHTLEVQFAKEIDRSLQRINEAISPYTRFVRAEHEKLLSAQADLDLINQRERRLRMDVEEL